MSRQDFEAEVWSLLRYESSTLILYKELSSSIFQSCQSVSKALVTPEQISSLCKYKGINALYWPSIINYQLLPPHSVLYCPSKQLFFITFITAIKLSAFIVLIFVVATSTYHLCWSILGKNELEIWIWVIILKFDLIWNLAIGLILLTFVEISSSPPY